MSASSLSTVRLARMREVLTGHVARGDLPGLVALVARRGEVHVEAIGSMEAGGGSPWSRGTSPRKTVTPSSTPPTPRSWVAAKPTGRSTGVAGAANAIGMLASISAFAGHGHGHDQE